MQRFIVLTGATEGLGNAVLFRLLKRSKDGEKIIGISRRNTDEIVGFSSLSEEAKARYIHMQADLSQPKDVEQLVKQITSTVTQDKGAIASVFLINGTGFLDTDVAKDPSLVPLMEALNLETPLALSKGLRPIFENNASIFYFSGVIAHPSISDPLLRTHAAIKKRAVAVFKETFGDQLKVVMPGAYETDMLKRNMVRTDGLLEWYAAPMANPHDPKGLATYLAKMALKGSDKVPSPIIRPRITRFLVTTHSQERLSRALPNAIRMTARTVLHQTGQSDADHDRRVTFFKAQNMYGSAFPYDGLMSQHLWPAWASLFVSRIMRFFGLLR